MQECQQKTKCAVESVFSHQLSIEKGCVKLFHQQATKLSSSYLDVQFYEVLQKNKLAGNASGFQISKGSITSYYERLINNSLFLIVNFKHDIACWIQPVKFMAQHYQMMSLYSTIYNAVAYFLRRRNLLLFKRQVAQKAYSKTFMVNCNLNIQQVPGKSLL